MTNDLKMSRRTFARSLALGLGGAYAAPALANEGFFGNQAEWTQRFDADGRIGVPRMHWNVSAKSRERASGPFTRKRAGGWTSLITSSRIALRRFTCAHRTLRPLLPLSSMRTHAHMRTPARANAQTGAHARTWHQFCAKEMK